MKDLIIVTGCSGRIGTYVTERFGEMGYQVVGFDIVEPKKEQAWLDYRRVDLTSDESVNRGFEYVRHTYGDRIAAFIHLAAYYSFTGGDPSLYDKITVQGTERVLKGCQSFICEQFLFSSTMLIYAPCEVGQKIHEDSPILPKWDYPRSKVKTEALIHNQHGSIPTVILRIAGCYDDECHSIPIANQIQRICEKQWASRVFPGDMTHGASYLHLEDLTEAIWLAVQNRKQLPPEVVLLIGEGVTLSYDELQKEISQLLFGEEVTTIRIPKEIAKTGAWLENHTPFVESTFIKPWMIDIADDNYSLDITKARQVLGWEPKHFIKTSLPKMIQFLKTDPVKFYKENDLKMPKKWLERYATK
jgi:nucleoside-diphosphate-sugar epimerase